MEIARLKKITFYDAIYLQAAEELEASVSALANPAATPCDKPA